MLLEALEKREGKRIAAQFDLLAGTSTGGILTIGAAAGLPASRMVELYRDKGTGIFYRSAVHELASGGGVYGAKYPADFLEAELGSLLGHDRLSHIQVPELLVPTYCTHLPHPMDVDSDGTAESASSWFFKSWKARHDQAYDFSLVDVARATSAAPTYFPAAEILNGLGEPFVCVDGGTFANNPSLCAIAAAKQLWPGEELRVVSLGTGSKVKSIAAGDWGYSQWAPHVAGVFMDGAADTVSYVASALLGANFVRCELPITAPVDEAFDDADAKNIASLMALGSDYTKKFLPLV